MFNYNILRLIIIVCCLTDSLALDCSQYHNDLDIVGQFPFPMEMSLTEDEYENRSRSGFLLNTNGNFVEKIRMVSENMVPSSVFCLRNLTTLRILSTPFENSMFHVYIVNFYFEYFV